MPQFPYLELCDGTGWDSPGLTGSGVCVSRGWLASEMTDVGVYMVPQLITGLQASLGHRAWGEIWSRDGEACGRPSLMKAARARPLLNHPDGLYAPSGDIFAAIA